MPALMAHILAFPLLSLQEVKLTKPADSVTLSCYVKTSGFQKIILKVGNSFSRRVILIGMAILIDELQALNQLWKKQQ